MTPFKSRLLALAVLAGCSTGALADATLDEARKLIGERKAAAAYELLAPLENERAGDPEYDYILGLASLEAGRPGEAVFALERVLAVQPDHSLARAEIARAYYALSELETAKQEFENAKAATDVPDSARETMARYLEMIERAQTGGRQVAGFFTVGAGYDTNVNSGTDQSRVAIPLFNNLDFQLNDQARGSDQGYGLVAGGVDVVEPINKTWAYVLGGRGYYRHTENPFSTSDAYVYGGARATVGRHQFTFAGQGEHFAIDADTLRFVYGGFGQWAYAIDNRSRLTTAIQVTQIDYPDLPNRDAVRTVASMGYLRAIGGKREPVIYAGVYGGVENENRDNFQQFGYSLYGGRLGGSLELAPRIRGFASVSFEQRDYDGDDPIFLRTRDDTQFNITGGFDYALSKDWTVRPNVTYTNSDSNITINDYDRVIGGIDVTFRF